MTPTNFSDGRRFTISRRFHAAWAAFHWPAPRPTRRSGTGAVVDMSSFEEAQPARDSAATASRENDASLTEGSVSRR